MKRKLLVLNIFPTVFPPASGGTLRYFHIYHKLSHYYDITLLSQSNNNKGSVIEYSQSFREYLAERDPLYLKIRQELHVAARSYELPLIMCLELANHPALYKKYFKKLYHSSDIIIHESPYLLDYDIYFNQDNKPRIFNSHNHEYALAKQIWKDEKAREYLSRLYEAEQRLTSYADLIFATSGEQREEFIHSYGLDSQKVKLAPNGINTDEWLPRRKKAAGRPKALFIGAHYPPNIQAVKFIIDQLADKCPNLDFIIAGGCCSPFRKHRKGNVKLLGSVRHKQKLSLFAEADIAINPVIAGSGVNIKTLEFLSAGIPLFSTVCGVRGLELVDQKHYIHAEHEDFADILNKFAGRHELLNVVAANGQKSINSRFSWKSIAGNIYDAIEETLST
ncbi:glycosyltransferase family 4 protein [Cytobacillus firmus]|uniref:glycosyltransferase family 4 protein n=1 Tax=Cytobacillus firmus TaxID=1399 RepID=UPI002079A5FC|nr:glycosyltransferase family 4 protein [Cytobacillus firmus]USK38556.1 glycosyltransferase family 4 protein [Cytobacillus firmus]